MADGARFDIAIEAQSIGLDASADQLSALAERMQSVDSVATEFDTAVAAASKRLEEASAAAQLASRELASAENRYSALEREADRAARAVEKAAAAGKDTSKLQVDAQLAARAMNAQAAAVEKLREKSEAASAAQTKMAGALKTIQGKQTAAVATTRKAQAATDAAGKSAKGLGKAGEKAGEKGSESFMTFLSSAANVYRAIAQIVTTVGKAVYGLGEFAIASNPAAMMRLTAASQRMNLSFKRLFSGLKLDGFIGGLEKIMALFDEGNASAKGLKKLIETIFQPLFDGGAKLAPLVGEAFKGLIYGALRVVLAVLKIRNAIWASLSPETRKQIKDFSDKLLSLENAFTLGEFAANALFVALFPLFMAFTLIASSIALVTSAVDLLWDGYWDLVDWLAQVTTDFIDWAKNLADDAYTWGENVILGFIDGITGSDHKLKGAADSASKMFEDAMKANLKIKSPSRLMMEIGAYTVEGFALGVEGGEGQVERASRSLAGAVEDGAQHVAAPAAGTSSTNTTTSRSVVIQSLTIGDSPVARETFGDFKRALLEVLEGASLTIGGGEAVAR